MANYNLIVNSKFQPFSLERYLKPYQIYGEAYNNLENQYNDLTARAETVESMANEQTDPIAYNRYKNYSNKLREVVDSLATRGLNPTSRGSLMGLRRGYIKDIVPIQKAYETRQKYIDEQRQLSAKDNTTMYDRVASQMSLDDLMANPSMSYTPVSGALITRRVADALKNYKGQMLKAGKWRNTANGQLLERIEQKGLTRSDLVDIMQHPDRYPDITNIINDAVLSTGIQNWNDRNALTNAYRYAYEGLPYGLGDSAINVRENKDYMNAYQRWKWNKERQELPPNEGMFTLPGLRPQNIFTAHQRSQAAKNIKDFSQYFTYKDGKLMLNKKGTTEYFRENISYGSSLEPNSPTLYEPSKFRLFIDSIGGAKYFDKNHKSQPGNIGNLWKKYMDLHSGDTYDATKYTEAMLPLDSESIKNFKDQYVAHAGDKTYPVDFDENAKLFTTDYTQEPLSKTDLANIKSGYQTTSPYGSTFVITYEVKDGDDIITKTARIPESKSISSTYGINRDKKLKEAMTYRDAIVNGSVYDVDYDDNGNVKFDRNGNPIEVMRRMTPEDLEIYNNNYIDKLNRAAYYNALSLKPIKIGENTMP